ncbi:MAG: 5'-nucleotidase C-terminal domain-containing protein [Syntrophorhabdales bacterium]|nr:5'-nucleotidase C-terminal domain-containing protein [Syntrophorhabdales bacterium]
MKKNFLILLVSVILSVVFALNAFCEEIELRVLYMNDFHGFAEEQKSDFKGKMVGGIAYLAGMVDRLRKERQSIFLAAGDMIQGSNWANLFKGRPVIEVMNRMGFDAMVIGNHEFNFGVDILRQRISEASFPCLGANIIGLEGIKPFVIKELKGVKIAITGLTTEETPIYTHPDNVKGLIFQPSSEVAERLVKKLRDRADVIIILSHLGFHNDMILAQRVEGIDIIIGGHSHTKIEKPVSIGKTIIVQAWEHGKVLGVLDLTLKDGKIRDFSGRLEDIVPSDKAKNNDVLKIVKRYKNRLKKVVSEKIGITEVDLDGENGNKRETNFGNLVADIVRERAQSDIAIINGGSIKIGIRKGWITMGQIYDALPFNNYIVSVKMKGKDIIEALRHGTNTREDNAGRFPQVSGISFIFSRVQGGGTIIKEVIFKGRPIDPDGEYTVATTDFLMAGGDGYKVFRGHINSHMFLYQEPGRWIRDLVVDYIRDKKSINPVVEGRIIELK